MVQPSDVKPPPRTESDVLRSGIAMLRDRLPSSWSVLNGLDREIDNTGADSFLLIRAPDGREVEVVVEAKLVLESRNVAAVREQVADLVGPWPGRVGMVASRYLAKSVRERLADAGISYVDATGNLLLQAESPGLFIFDRGDDRDPWRGPGRPKGTLKGEPAAKVVRALLDFPGPWKVRELVEVSGASTGSVYRVLEFLESEELATRDAQGLFEIADWQAVLQRWSRDYQFLHTNVVTRWIAPRGIKSFLDQVRDSPIYGYALTGSIAAEAWAPYAPARSAMVYVADAERAAGAWGLRPTDSGANVLLAKPTYDVAFERTVEALHGLQLAAPTQVAADLMTGPGRSPAEAEELMDWMVRNEQSWR